MAVYYLDTSALVKRYALPPLTFVLADARQREAATAEVFPVEDPNEHR
jgi:hypothetical protein